MKKDVARAIVLCGLFLASAGMMPQTAVAQTTQKATVNATALVTGVVVDTDGEPLPGATVRVKGTKLATVTDVDGNFAISGVDNKPVKITVSFLGMKNAEKTWNGKKMKFVLEATATSLTEVAVVGYQELDRRKTTAAVTTVKMEDILMPDMTTVDQALEGRIPDLVFTQNSGSVGATARVRVRGTSTLVGNREPLWVLDGFIIEDPVNV